MSDDQVPLPEGWALQVHTEGASPIRYIVKAGTNDKIPVFQLKSTAYYDVQNYVFTGMAFPKTESDFEKQIPHDSVEALNKVDAAAWNRIMTTLVTIQNHCEEFNNTSMANWTLITTDVVSYAERAKRQISGRDNLTENLLIMVDPKYRDESSHDQNYRDAAEVCQAICEELAQSAKDFETKTTGMIAAVEAFQGLTLVDKQNVDGLEESFNGTDEQVGWSSALDSKLVALRADAKLQHTTAITGHSDYTFYVTVSATTPTYVWIFPWGTISSIVTAGVYGKRATDAKARYEAAEAQELKDNSEIAILVKLVNFMTHMASSVQELDKKMAAAIAGMTEIKALFAKEKETMNLIAASMGDASTYFHRSFALRKRVLSKFTEASKDWDTVEALANQFLKTGSPVIVAASNATGANAVRPSNTQEAPTI